MSLSLILAYKKGTRVWFRSEKETKSRAENPKEK